MQHCPLCHHDSISQVFDNRRRHFFECQTCALVFAAPGSYLLPAAEKQRYGRAGRDGKQKQLAQFIATLLQQLQTLQSNTLEGLNFGRVLAPALLLPIQQAGHQLHQYDPFFAPEHQLLRRQYDFISCYRVFEHFHLPAKEWQIIVQALKPGGWLAISTPLLQSTAMFAKWHYKNNPTHVSFYQPQTFAYLAAHSCLQLIFAQKDFVLMQKAS
ncbi:MULTISPECIES: methyltransferase domain-containing protein [Shewanella]|uniref:methyltransferase domain-containing protein n=1 Tax=Shewanella TaxID=22 RepID=UPI0016780610|nr:methyltransferase domain-containing protein [Shewanella fodinae]MCL2908158.1 class I SAM-dependent methyltransferase [Shewanella fodinae]GGZ13759.1 methyltransferase [Shewanella fodinae]